MRNISPQQLYLGGVALWALVLAIVPPWIGQGYWQVVGSESDIEGQWYKSGAFGLQGGVDVLDFIQQAPIFLPPRGFGGSHSVRWPWQSPSGSHVELSWGMLAVELALGLIVLGVAAHFLARKRRTPPNLVVTLGWWIAIALAGAFLVFVVAGFLTMGGILELIGVQAVLGLGLVAGVAKGAAVYNAEQASLPDSGRPAPVRGESLAYFGLGILLAGCLAIAVADIAAWFRGGVSNFQYLRPQRPIDVTAALVIVIASASLARWLRKRRMPRSLGAGLLIAGVALTVTFNYWDPTFP